LFRIGIKRTVRLTLQRDEVDMEMIEQFLKSSGATWGARPEIVSRATFGLIQLLDAIRDTSWRAGPVEISVSFDEFNLDIYAAYDGEPLEFPQERPSARDIVESEDGVRRLAGFMLRRCADRLRSQSKDGRASLFLHYDH
jgi:NCS2 family nucleobase:cation symporter-2